MDGLQSFLSWQFVLFCLALVAITSVVRKIVEYFLEHPSVPTTKHSTVWTGLVLPIFPIILGPTVAVLVKQYPYPDDLKSAGSRVIFGLVAGLICPIAYRIVKKFLKSKAISLTNSDPPSNG